MVPDLRWDHCLLNGDADHISRGKTFSNLLFVYRIKKDYTGTTLVCNTCPYTERVQVSERIGNPRTLAAQAMPKHFHAEHSRETHMREMATVMERQHARR